MHNSGRFTSERLRGNSYAKTHGMSHTKIYDIWNRMRSRCSCVSDPEKKRNYYDRGIAVCKEWDEFDKFFRWAIESGYMNGLTLDRKNVNKGYSPDNCRWATPKQQSNNRRITVKITYKGRTLSVSEWAGITGLPYHVVFKRYKNNWTPERIIETPLMAKKSHKLEKSKNSLRELMGSDFVQEYPW